MANLFPEDMDFTEIDITDFIEDEIDIVNEFKDTYAFDFKRGDFKRGPDGKVIRLNRLEAYIQWCQKVLLTRRLKHMAYSHVYGQEYYTLIGEPISKDAIELEVERMTREALAIHPYTKKVDSFQFKWRANKEDLYFEFDVETVHDELFTLDHTIEMG